MELLTLHRLETVGLSSLFCPSSSCGSPRVSALSALLFQMIRAGMEECMIKVSGLPFVNTLWDLVGDFLGVAGNLNEMGSKTAT